MYTLIRNLSTVTYNYTLMIVVLIYPRKSFPFQTNKQTKTIDDPKDFERRSLHIVSRGQKSYVLILEITHCAFCNRISDIVVSEGLPVVFPFLVFLLIRLVHRRIVWRLCKHKRWFISTIYRNLDSICFL